VLTGLQKSVPCAVGTALHNPYASLAMPVAVWWIVSDEAATVPSIQRAISECRPVPLAGTWLTCGRTQIAVVRVYTVSELHYVSYDVCSVSL
jgi:hypothetical protein